ncbi:MAG: hypothetical protein ACYDH0_09430 [Candidatus Aminicenantales bacterium]
MGKSFNFITLQLAINDKDPFNKELDSLYFSAAHRLSSLRVGAQIADEAMKDESLGHLWKDVEPSQEGYVFEVASELPYVLPSVSDFAEYELFVGAKQYLICNRMVRAYFSDPSKLDVGPEYFLVHLLGLPSLKQHLGTKGISLCPVPMKCFISSRFVCRERTAEEAVKNNFLSWQAEHLFGIGQILRAIRATIPLESSNIMPVSSASCPITWVAIKGENKRTGCEQFAGNLGMIIPLSTIRLDQRQSSNIRALLLAEESPDVSEDAMGLAKTFLFYGYLDLAVIQVCTACETLISKAVKKDLEKRDVSKGTMDEYYRNVNYCELLNFFLPLIADISELKNHKDLLGNLNWARSKRNELVHYGITKEKITKEMLQKVLRSVEELNRFIKQLERRNEDDHSIPPSLHCVDHPRRKSLAKLKYRPVENK